MKRQGHNIVFSIVAVLLIVIESSLGNSREAAVETYRQLGYVVVTPEGPRDGGDFGPLTPGTKTAGIQEALDYAQSVFSGPHKDKDIYIFKGTYTTTETIRIPWLGEKFRFDALETHINYLGTDGDAVVIDSQMNGRFIFGYVSNLNSRAGWCVRLKPQDAGPSTDSNLPPEISTPVITLTEFYFNAVVCRAMPDLDDPEQEVKGNGILFDATSAPIIWNDIFVVEVNTADVAVETRGNFSCNWLKVPFIHGCHTAAILDGTDNRIDMSITPEWIKGCVGARLLGQRNNLKLTVWETAPGKNLIFEPESRDNVVYATNLPNGITNSALIPTNRIISNTPIGFGITTPDFPESGQDVTNRNPYSVEVIIQTPGTVSDWTLTDVQKTAKTFSTALAVGHLGILQPGEKIRFSYIPAYNGLTFFYKPAPTWKWRALR